MHTKQHHELTLKVGKSKKISLLSYLHELVPEAQTLLMTGWYQKINLHTDGLGRGVLLKELR